MTLRLRTADGGLVEVPIAARRPLTVGVELTGDIASDLRRVVRADVIRRAADHHRAVARVVTLSEPDPTLIALAAATNCRPLVVETLRPDVAIGEADALIARIPVAVGVPLPELSGLDLRHALLGGAVDEVARWQHLVAEWAESPSKPMCAEYVERAYAGADDDVDTATLIAVLREVEVDPDLPPGCKFEMFAHLDTFVGLDLTADVGLPPL
ncbi:MAG TPA: hypothetical protein VNA14_01755 [Mycobacteriales bacterium]|nr:hypothetical protein [Mycobacteriales bacterium]